MTSQTLYDPPSGWRYGFPKPYAPLEGESLADTLLRDGYPQHEIDNGGAKYCRFIGWDLGEEFANDNDPIDTTARTAVEHVTDREHSGSVSDRAPVPRRIGRYIRTYSGGKFWPHDPRAEDIHIVDIAHSLSRKNRYGGHIRQEHYSVAEHCVLGTRWLRETGRSDEIAFAFLMHDAPEFGGIGDVSSPAKKGMPEYRGVEGRIWSAVAERFDLPEVLPAIVHEVDSRITTDEMTQAMHGPEPYAPIPLGVQLQFWKPERAKAEFLALFEELYGEE